MPKLLIRACILFLVVTGLAVVRASNLKDSAHAIEVGLADCTKELTVAKERVAFFQNHKFLTAVEKAKGLAAAELEVERTTLWAQSCDARIRPAVAERQSSFVVWLVISIGCGLATVAMLVATVLAGRARRRG